MPSPRSLATIAKAPTAPKARWAATARSNSISMTPMRPVSSSWSLLPHRSPAARPSPESTPILATKTNLGHALQRHIPRRVDRLQVAIQFLQSGAFLLNQQRFGVLFVIRIELIHGRVRIGCISAQNGPLASVGERHVSMRRTAIGLRANVKRVGRVELALRIEPQHRLEPAAIGARHCSLVNPKQNRRTRPRRTRSDMNSHRISRRILRRGSQNLLRGLEAKHQRKVSNLRRVEAEALDLHRHSSLLVNR